VRVYVTVQLLVFAGHLLIPEDVPEDGHPWAENQVELDFAVAEVRPASKGRELRHVEAPTDDKVTCFLLA